MPHHDQREPSLPQVGDRAERALIEPRGEQNEQRAGRQRDAGDAADVGGDVAVVAVVAVVAGLEHHLGDEVELQASGGRRELAVLVAGGRAKRYGRERAARQASPV